MINYIIQVVLYQVLFLTIYDFFLSKETFFTKNRWYLLVTATLSFLIPFIKIPKLQKEIIVDNIVYLPEIVLSPEKVIEKASWYQSIDYFNLIYLVGIVFFILLFITNLHQIITLIITYKKVKNKNYTLVLLPEKAKAFSFFNFIFLGMQVSPNNKEKIIQHELVHSKQKHTIDLLFFEILKAIMWFNPMLYIYQKRITLVHEYISDAVVSKNQTKEKYINVLLSDFFKVDNISFINQFYKQTFIKKRIMMMKKKKSKKMNQLKYLLLIPVLTSMLVYSSCSENEGDVSNESKKELQTRYFDLGNELKITKGEKETYLDSYFGIGTPNGVEITYNDLSLEEKYEYDEIMSKLNKLPESNSKDISSNKIYKSENGRNVFATIIDFSKMKKNNESISKETSFLDIEQAPTFPGCELGDKSCFNKSIQKHFAKNFNVDMVNDLGLSSGRKRAYVGFTIDKEGNITDVKVRAPHLTIKESITEIMNSLPKVVPGESDGEKIAVKYSIPFTLIVN
ncbi:M56 family metallopeptidase [Polaribacter sp.]|nr:M56 family metallopeptidase [Polaribacter sp.]